MNSRISNNKNYVLSWKFRYLIFSLVSLNMLFNTSLTQLSREIPAIEADDTRSGGGTKTINTEISNKSMSFDVTIKSDIYTNLYHIDLIEKENKQRNFLMRRERSDHTRCEDGHRPISTTKFGRVLCSSGISSKISKIYHRDLWSYVSIAYFLLFSLGVLNL